MSRFLQNVGLFLVAGCGLILLGQGATLQQNPLNLATYESFFAAVSRLTTALPLNGQTTINGQSSDLVPPRLEDALGITAAEAQLLRSVATDCDAKNLAIQEALKPLVKELRFAALAEEAPPESVILQYNELNRKHAQTVLDHIQELKTAFRERFQLIETFVSARKNSESFFGLRPQVVRQSDN